MTQSGVMLPTKKSPLLLLFVAAIYSEDVNIWDICLSTWSRCRAQNSLLWEWIPTIFNLFVQWLSTLLHFEGKNASCTFQVTPLKKCPTLLQAEARKDVQPHLLPCPSFPQEAGPAKVAPLRRGASGPPPCLSGAGSPAVEQSCKDICSHKARKQRKTRKGTA